MKKFKNKCLGGVAVVSVLACTNLVQASTTVAPEVTFHHQQVSPNQVNVNLGMTGLSDQTVAVEVSVVADDIQSVLSATSLVANSYQTHSVQTLADGKEKLSVYIVSQDKATPLPLENGKLAGMNLSLSTDGKLSLDEKQITVKAIEKDYVTSTYHQVPLVYTEEQYIEKPEQDNNGDSGNNDNVNGDTNGDTNGDVNGDQNNGSTGDNDQMTDEESSSQDNESSISGSIESTKPESSVSFTDLQGHWAQSAIYNMASKGIIKGYADGTFKPNASITRAEFATLLARAFGIKTTNLTNPFTDVVADKWYANGILALYDAGITSGRPDGTFGVNAPITNEEISAMLYRAMTVCNIQVDTSSGAGIQFTDQANISNYAKEAVSNLVKLGIISGKPDGSFGPKLSTSRAQVAVMLDRVFALVK